MISKVNWNSFHRFLQISNVEFNGTNENNTVHTFVFDFSIEVTLVSDEMKTKEKVWDVFHKCLTLSIWCNIPVPPFTVSFLWKHHLWIVVSSQYLMTSENSLWFFTMTSLLDLPLELLHYVLDFLPLSSVYRLGAVCRHLHRLVHQDDEFWRRRVKLELQLRLLNPDWQCSYKEEVEYT